MELLERRKKDGSGAAARGNGTRPRSWQSLFRAPEVFEPELENIYLFEWRLEQTLYLRRFAGW